MRVIELDKLLKNPKSFILILFNESSLSHYYSNISKNIDKQSLLRYWLFYEHDEETNKTNLLPVDQNYQFYIDGTPISLVTLHNILLSLEKKWNNLVKNKLSFPDITINGSIKSGSYSPSNPDFITLSVSELKNEKNLEFIISHELGHKFYNNYKNKENSKNKYLEYLKNNKLKSSLFVSLILLNVVNFFVSISLLPVWASVFYGWAILSTMILFSYKEIGSFLSFDERFKNYTQEFFADHFAQNLLGNRFHGYYRPEVIGGDLDFNVYSHPSAKLRELSLKLNFGESVDSFKNLVEIEPKYFMQSSFFELDYFWSKKIKFLNLWKKKKNDKESI